MNNRNIKFSVIIPTYNVGHCIERTLQSILKQTYPPNEIIVVDAESTDNTLEIVQSYGDRIKLIQQKKAGISAGRNDGIVHATSEWFAFLDGDDTWAPDFLKSQAELLQRNPDLMWTGANFIRYSCDKDQGTPATNPEDARILLNNKDYFESFFKACQVGIRSQTGGYIINRKVFDQVGMFDTKLMVAEDTDLFFRIAFRYPQFGYLPEPMTTYYHHRPGGITQQSKKTDYILRMLDKQIENAREYNMIEEFKPVGSKIVHGWLKGAIKDKRIFEVELYLKKYVDLLSFKQKVKFRLYTLVPHLTLLWFTMKSKRKSHKTKIR